MKLLQIKRTGVILLLFAALNICFLCPGQALCDLPSGAKLKKQQANHTDASTDATNSEAILREKLIQRSLKEYSSVITNGVSSNLLRYMIDQMILHPSLGLEWDEVPAPTLKGDKAMTAVNAFILANGWNMETNILDLVFGGSDKMKPISGLPWEVIKDRKFQAVSHQGVLYVVFSGWHHCCQGAAYNPQTNAIPATITGFKPIGAHWYAWIARDSEGAKLPPLLQKYEGTSNK